MVFNKSCQVELWSLVHTRDAGRHSIISSPYCELSLPTEWKSLRQQSQCDVLGALLVEHHSFLCIRCIVMFESLPGTDRGCALLHVPVIASRAILYISAWMERSRIRHARHASSAEMSTRYFHSHSGSKMLKNHQRRFGETLWRRLRVFEMSNGAFSPSPCSPSLGSWSSSHSALRSHVLPTAKVHTPAVSAFDG